jgi:hypothetical protein
MKFFTAIATTFLGIAGGSPFVGAQHTGTCPMKRVKDITPIVSSSFLTILPSSPLFFYDEQKISSAS